MQYQLRPLRRGVVLRPDLAGKEATTAGGIVLPGGKVDKDPNSTTEADVVAVGKRCTEVAVGDRAVIGRYAGHDVTLNGEKLLIIKETEVFGILEK